MTNRTQALTRVLRFASPKRMSLLGAEDLRLLQKAIAQGLLVQAEVVHLLQNHKHRYENTQHSHIGYVHQISGQGKAVFQQQLLPFQVAPMLYRERDWQSWATHHLLLNESGEELQAIAYPSSERKTLLQWIQKTETERVNALPLLPAFVFDSDFGSALWQGPQAHFWFPESSQRPVSTGPTDVLVTATPYLFLADRGKGEVRVFDCGEQQIVDVISVRKSPSSLSIAMVFDGQTLYLNGQENSTLLSYNPLSQQSEKWDLGLGQLGNMRCDGANLMLMVRKPHPALACLNLDRDDLEDPLPLPGELLSCRGHAPIDLMAFHTERKQLVVLHAAPDATGNVSTALLHFNPVTGRHHSTPLTLTQAPGSLSFAQSNPALALTQTSLWDLLIAEGQLSKDDYEALLIEPEIPTAWQPPPPLPPSPSVRPSPAAHPVPEYSSVKPPDHCPLCDQRLMGLWDCPVCGYEVPSPVRQARQQVASLSEDHGLQPGVFPLPDPHGRRLLLLNTHHRVQQEIACAQLAEAQRAISLGQEQFLMLDSVRSVLWRMDIHGKTQWQWDENVSEAHRLDRPAAIAALIEHQRWHYLIADTYHRRVLRVNESQEILETIALAEAPLDVQYTHQKTYLITHQKGIIEQDAAGNDVRYYTADDYGWHTLRFARRTANDETWVLDEGSQEMVVLDAEGLIARRFFYNRSHFPEAMQLKNPHYFHRLSTGDLLLSNAQRAIQVMPLQKKLSWHSELRDLKLPEEKAVLPTSVSPPASPVSSPPAAAVSVRSSLASKHTPFPPKMGFQVPRKRVAENPLDALLKKNVTPGAKESYSPSIVYTDPHVVLEKRVFYVLDHKNNSIVKVNRKGKVTWHYGFDMGQSLAKPAYCMAQKQAGQSVWIADTHHNRVLEVGLADKTLYRELKGPAHDGLSWPRSIQIKDDAFLIADQRNRRLVEFVLTPDGEQQVQWQFDDPQWISAPHYAEYLENGNLLFVDAFLNHVVEVTRDKKVVWRYNHGLFSPIFATRLANQNTLISDTHHHRVIEVNPEKQTVWEYVGHAKSNRLNPTHVERLSNGNTVITYFNHSKLVELTPEKKCVWSYTLGKDLFQAPVIGDEEIHVRQEGKPLVPFYNPIEKRQLAQALEQGFEVLEVHIRCFDHIQMKSVRAQLILLRLEAFGLVFKTFPPPEDLLAGQWGRSLIFTCKIAADTSREQLEQTLFSIAEVVSVTLKPIAL
jgi:hypothetical protein